MEDLLFALGCAHEAMTECCDGCGHFHCPDCGLSWDEAAEGSLPIDDVQNA
jgi:hypothetical protein